MRPDAERAALVEDDECTEGDMYTQRAIPSLLKGSKVQEPGQEYITVRK
jgi:hypothetical protein